MRYLAAMAVIAFPWVHAPAVAQAAPPSTRSPWVDSTHITGLAQKVIPDTSVPPPAPAPVPAAPPSQPPAAPSTIQELLDRMNGATLYFREFTDYRSGWSDMPAWWRVQVSTDGAAVQSHSAALRSWVTRCVLGPAQSRCEATPIGTGRPIIVHDITPFGITITSAKCQWYEYGAASAYAIYTWDFYRSGLGAFQSLDRRLQPSNNGYSGFWFQHGNYSSSCYVEASG